jgi:hypothetical protein
MTDGKVRDLLDRLTAAMDPALEYEARHEDFIAEFPQSGERFDRDGLRRLQEAYPGGTPEIRIRRLTGTGEIWTPEVVIQYADGTVWHGVGLIEFREGKIWRETRYYAEPFEAPAWRASWNLDGGPSSRSADATSTPLNPAARSSRSSSATAE